MRCSCSSFSRCVTARAGGALGAQLHERRPASATPRAVAHASRRRVVRFARRFLGVRYVYGGVSPRTGFDCSGFTRFVYAHFGIALPHYSGAQFSTRAARLARRRCGPATSSSSTALGHVGLYVGGGRFIHAPHTGTRVSVAR